MKLILIFLAISSLAFCKNPKKHFRPIKPSKNEIQKTVQIDFKKKETSPSFAKNEKLVLMRNPLPPEIKEEPQPTTQELAQDFISLNEKTQFFTNCCMCLDNCAYCSNCCCIETTYSASSTTASCTTPKMITAKLSSPMPALSCFYVKCDVPQDSCGTTLGLIDLTNSLSPKPLVKCLTCPFSDFNITITYVFCANLCIPPQDFQNIFTLSIVDDLSGSCCP